MHLDLVLYLIIFQYQLFFNQSICKGNIQKGIFSFNSSITLSQVCFLSFLNYESLNKNCIGLGFTSKYPKYIYKENDIKEIYIKKLNSGFFTSVWCSSSSTSDLRCKFSNLCYLPIKKQFIFISSPYSILYGLESILELSNKLLSSSVRNHNAFKVPFASVNTSTYYNYSVNYIQNKVLLFSRFKPDNLQHIFHDDLLPLYFTLLELLTEYPLQPYNKILTLIIDHMGKFEFDYLYKAVTKNIYFISDVPHDNLLCFSKAYIGINKMSIFNLYGFNKENKNIKININKYQLETFTKYFLDSFYLHSGFNQIPYNSFEVVLINRVSNRKITNIDDIKYYLKAYIESEIGIKPKIKIMSLEHEGILTIIKSLLTADLLVGMHGAALILSIFMPPKSSIIELWPYGLKPTVVPVYKIVCDIKEMHFQYWVNKDIKYTKVHPEYPLYYGGIINWSDDQFPDLFRKLSTQILENISCCDNPEWLIRIYQDTVVNVYPNLVLKSDLLQDLVTNVLQIKFNMESKYHLNSIPSNQQYLSQVEDLHCFINKDDPAFIKFILEWTAPWNFEEIGCNDISYEIIIKESSSDFELSTDGKDIIHTYYTKALTFQKKYTHKISSLKIWITSLCNNLPGGEIFFECR